MLTSFDREQLQLPNDEFTAAFCLSDRNFFRYFTRIRGISAARAFTPEQVEQNTDFVSNVFAAGEAVAEEEVRGFLAVRGMIENSIGPFGNRYREMIASEDPEINNPESIARYCVMMERRDMFVQFLGGYLSATDDVEYVSEPINIGFEDFREFQEFEDKYQDLLVNNEDFKLFYDEVGAALFLHYPQERWSDQIVRDTISEANRIGVHSFLYFNRLFPLMNQERANALEGMDIPADLMPIIDLMDENSVNTMLTPPNRQHIVNFIANYFSKFNAPPVV
jgi:hypothetical protein